LREKFPEDYDELLACRRLHKGEVIESLRGKLRSILSERRQHATGSDSEDRAQISRPVEVPIRGLDQPRDGVGAIRPVEAEQRGESLRR
jgi:hypothetical protein